MSEPMDGWYVNKGSGSVGHIVEVNEGFAILEVVHPKWSKFSIPIAEYDSTWPEQWRPARPEDMPSSPVARPPKSGIFPMEEPAETT